MHTMRQQDYGQQPSKLTPDYYDDDDDRTQYNINVRYSHQLPQMTKSARSSGSRSSSTSSSSSSVGGPSSPSMATSAFYKSHSRTSSTSSNISNFSVNFGQIPFPNIQSSFPDYTRHEDPTPPSSSSAHPFLPSHNAHHSSTSSILSINSAGSGIATPNSTYSLSPSSSNMIHAFPSVHPSHSQTNLQNNHQNHHENHHQSYNDNTHTLTSSNTSANTNTNNDTLTRLTVPNTDDDTAKLSFPAPPSAAKKPDNDTVTPENPRPKKRVRQSTNYFTNISNMVCLFWFNEYSVLEAAYERAQQVNLSANGGDASLASLRFSKLTTPTNSFKPFIMNVIKHTQLPPTAVSLALYYILRLKKNSSRPIVGNANSEYRVFSVALMLANKFLDDNTYTNKTWAEVTHLPLKEISAMEVEFLANMRYSLYVNTEDWAAWQRRLRVWLNIHSTISIPSPSLPSPAFIPSMAPAVPSIASYSLNPPMDNPYNIKRFMGEHLDRPAAKKLALSVVTPSPALSPSLHHGRMIAAERLSSSPYAPVFHVRTLLANAPFPSAYAVNNSGYSSASSSNMSSPQNSSHTVAPHQVLPTLPPPPQPLYYYTLADQKNKVNPSPQCGFLPPGSQTQSPAYQFDLEHYRPNSASFDQPPLGQVPPIHLGQPPPHSTLSMSSIPSIPSLCAMSSMAPQSLPQPNFPPFGTHGLHQYHQPITHPLPTSTLHSTWKPPQQPYTNPPYGSNTFPSPF